MTPEALRRQLLQVATERLERITALLAQSDAESRREALREAHTLKGEARITGRGDLAELTHTLEHAIEEDDAEAVERRLRELVDAVRGPDGRDDESQAEPGRVDLRHTLLRVELEQVASLSRACAEVRAAQIETARLADSLHALATRPPETAQRLIGHLRSLAGEARDLVFSHDQRVEALEHDLRGLRTIRVERVFQPLRRAVEEVARALDKAVDLRVRGEEVAVDRQVLDLVAEPLLHLVRNAVDHGIESAEDRARLHKPPRGQIGLAARVEGNRIRFVVEDDGRGIDPEGLAASGSAGLHVIFEPGFTTRANATEISGRGIGLDVVRRRVEAAGGSVHVDSKLGLGARFDVVVPLSLSSDAVVELEVDGSRYALPAADVVSVHEHVSTDTVGRATVVRIDDATLRYRDLGALLRIGPARRRAALAVLALDRRTVAVGADRVTHVPAALRHALDPFLEALAVVRGTVTIRDRLVTLLDPREVLRLALDANGARDSDEPPDTDEAPTRRELTVLVAEDSELTRDVLVSWLGSLGCRVHEAAHGAAALALLEQQSVDVLLTDLDMPVMDGFELIEHARRARPELPIVVLSTRAQAPDVERARGLGAVAHLSKTEVDGRALEEVLARWAGGVSL